MMRADEQSPSLVSSEAIRTHDDRSVLASRTSPTSNSQLTMSHTTELSKILDLIARSSYGLVSRFLDDLLTSKRYQKHSSVSDLHDPGNISKILNLLWMLIANTGGKKEMSILELQRWSLTKLYNVFVTSLKRKPSKQQPTSSKTSNRLSYRSLWSILNAFWISS